MTNFSTDKKLMALSWKQPYAELMLHGKIETRTWHTYYRGWVLICGSQSGYTSKQIENISGIIQKGRIHESLRNANIIGGYAIAIGKLVDCRPMQKEDEDKCFVEFYPDLYCHVYENVQAIEPFPWKGTQGWKEVDPETKNKIKLI